MSTNFQFEPECSEKEIVSLPFYLKVLMHETEVAHFNYIHCKSKPNNITLRELTQIFEFEMDLFKKSGTIHQPNSLMEIQQHIDETLVAGYQLYAECNEQRFLDVLVGLDQVKDIVKNVKELKRNEYNLVTITMVNEQFSIF